MSDTLEEQLPAHAPLGPSSAEGWATCADYVNANRGLPDVTSEPAAEGTVAHSISELCLALGLSAYDFIGIVTRLQSYVFEWDDEDAMLLQPGIEATLAMGGEFYGEHRVDISKWTLPGQFGTLDRAVVAINDDCITIIDLKWGRGIAVSPVGNKQLMLYALGFWWAIARHRTKATKFRLIIDQPRHAGGGGIWNTTLDELLAFGEWIRERAAATALPNPPRTASLMGCIWCRRRRAPGGCDTYDEYMINLLGQTWSDIDMGLFMDTPIALPRALTPERRSFLLLHKDSIRRWLEQLDEECMADAEAGLPTGDVKAVLGNKLPDKWKDKGVPAKPLVERLLGDEGFTKRLKSPKQISTAVVGNEEAAKAVAEFIDFGERKHVLVPIADARSPITTASEFDDLTDATESPSNRGNLSP